MAFTKKLTDLLEEACEVARADGAGMFAFILKDNGRDAQSYGVAMTPAAMFCALVAVLDELEDATGMDRKKIFKVLDRTLKDAPVIKEKVKAGDE